MKIKAHKLHQDDGSQVPFRRSPNQSGQISPRFLVMHYTAGSSAEGSISWLTNPVARASAHLVIGRDGSITQLVLFNRKAWHAGRSQWRGISGLNSHSIGIEIDNAGKLQGSPGRWRTSTGRAVSDSDVVELPHKFDGVTRAWQTYTDVQMEAVIKVAATLVQHYGIEEIIGHDDISPGRKSDPGPAFPMDAVRARAMGREDDAGEDLFKTTTALNIRVGPGTEHGKISEVSPLPEGTRLDVLESRGVWRFVDVQDVVNGEMDIVGWVHGRYIEPV